MPDTPPGPLCGRTGCPDPAVVQWQRRCADDPESTEAVHACVPHAITADAAACIHQPECPGPDSGELPACGCTPEPVVEEPTPAPRELPAGW